MKSTRDELEKKILEQYPQLRLSNLKTLKKNQLETLIANNEATLPIETLVKIFAEGNERADVNKKLNRQNSSLNAKLRKLVNWDKSAQINTVEKVNGKAEEDDNKLSSVNAVSITTVQEKSKAYLMIARKGINIFKKKMETDKTIAIHLL